MIEKLWELCVLLRHSIIQMGHLRAISGCVLFKLVTSFIVIYIMYILSEIYNLLLSQIPVMGPLWWGARNRPETFLVQVLTWVFMLLEPF